MESYNISICLYFITDSVNNCNKLALITIKNVLLYSSLIVLTLIKNIYQSKTFLMKLTFSMSNNKIYIEKSIITVDI